MTAADAAVFVCAQKKDCGKLGQIYFPEPSCQMQDRRADHSIRLSRGAAQSHGGSNDPLYITLPIELSPRRSVAGNTAHINQRIGDAELQAYLDARRDMVLY